MPDMVEKMVVQMGVQHNVKKRGSPIIRLPLIHLLYL
jgi:hypothetical protein